jgi:bis(5'-nucleosyl)-tetraphosphatase (symmetrical)
LTDYALGDIQGCYEPLMRLLDSIKFNDTTDRLWFVGDLVNRGPDSLRVLRFIQALPRTPRITLGNHDLHLLCLLLLPNQTPQQGDTLTAILDAPDAGELAHWLRMQPVLYHDPHLNTVMTHAGIAPHWTLAEAKIHARELECALQGDHMLDFLSHMYGNTPAFLTDELTPLDRLRVICNYFTRMRFCNQAGHLELSIKGPPTQPPQGCYPWYAVPNRKPLQEQLVFGHWAALEGTCPTPHIQAIDTGCAWGRTLTALRLQDGVRFSVPGI